MQGGIGRRTSPCNISRILWNLRLEQDDVVLSSWLLVVQFFNIHTRSLSDKKIATLPGVKLSKQRGYSFINLTHNRFEVNQRRYFLSITLLKLLSIVFLDFFKKLYQSFRSLLILLFWQFFPLVLSLVKFLQKVPKKDEFFLKIEYDRSILWR